MSLRMGLAGFLAGVSVVVGVMLTLLLLLVSFGFWSLLHDLSLQTYGQLTFWQMLGQSLGPTLSATPMYFWSGRWAMLALGLVGLLLTFVDTQRTRTRVLWRDYLAFVVLLGIISAFVVGLLNPYQESVYTWLANEPGLFDQRGLLLLPPTTLLFAAVFIALMLTYVVWLARKWWFGHWVVWLGANRVEWQRAAPLPPVAPEWLDAQARIAHNKEETHWLKQQPREVAAQAPPLPLAAPAPRRWLLLVLAGCIAAVLAVYPLLRRFQAVGPAVSTNELWVTAEARQAAASLSFTTAPRRVALTVFNPSGAGTVDFRLSMEGATTPVRKVDGVVLAPISMRSQMVDIDARRLPPGIYRLDVDLREGQNALVRVVALFGGGIQGQLAAAALGLAIGLALALGDILLLELLTRANWMDGWSAEGV